MDEKEYTVFQKVNTEQEQRVGRDETVRARPSGQAKTRPRKMAAPLEEAEVPTTKLEASSVWKSPTVCLVLCTQ